MALLVGVTGGIGAGKTTALKLLAEIGQQTLDADSAVHELYRPGSPVVTALQKRYGSEVADARNGVDRQRLADAVFRNENELNWLNQLIHPLVKARILQKAAAVQGPLFCGVPLLFEVEWERDFDCTLAIWCDPRTQYARLRSRGWKTAEIKRRQAVQLAMDEKTERADYALVNNSTIKILREQLYLTIERIARKSG